ncbi:U6 snRNA phosphodiesterase [Cimex lectularius]|uniref:U6 snRNA phosphodiesterase n=1 Tax=Cimex lectularius TaxID=79782 RepID=A0A8I6THZ3_CIMLE|nr:U6 snRNA phosphodiesterase [Cimex lectularius]
MSSLNLLKGYMSEEDTEAEAEADEQHSKLPLPNSLKRVFPKEEVEDDPEKHDGRVRSYPHQRGNWNSLVYIPYQRNPPFDLLCDQIIEFCEPEIELKRVEEPHISLTRTFVLLYHWIDNFVSAVKGSIQTFSRFDLQFDDLKVYCNEEGTRTFLALAVGFGKMEITKSVQVLDKCLSEYKLHPFYNEASFHMSILWCLGNKKSELEAKLPELNKVFEANVSDSLDLTIPITSYICKIGNKIYNLKLL